MAQDNRNRYDNNWNSCVWGVKILEDNIFFISQNAIFVMKGFAIIAMLSPYVYTYQLEWVEACPYFLTILGMLGNVFVSLFLFCSGYGFSIQYEKIINSTHSFKHKINSTIFFVCMRFIKFYSSYWFVFIVFIPITILFFNRLLPAAYSENVNVVITICADLLRIQGFQSYNMICCFNRLIIIFYILFPVMSLIIIYNKYAISICKRKIYLSDVMNGMLVML